MSKVYKYGIDISEHNGDIDLTPYQDHFVIIRAGYGWNSTDRKFYRNVKECIRLGIPFGFYWYSYALNAEQAKSEAEYFLKLIGPYRNDIKMGVWFDMEDADNWKRKRGFSFTNTNISKICYTWCKRVEEAGYYTGIYTSQSWMGYINPGCERFDKWTASWGSNNGNLQNDMSGYGSLHQYSSVPLDKSVSYVDISRFDINRNRVTPIEDINPKLSIDEIARCVINGDYGNGQERVDRLTSLGYNYNEVQNKVNEFLGTINVNKVYYTVKLGDTLQRIAEMYNTTIDRLVEMNGIENRNLIYEGEVIRVL